MVSLPYELAKAMSKVFSRLTRLMHRFLIVFFLNLRNHLPSPVMRIFTLINAPTELSKEIEKVMDFLMICVDEGDRLVGWE